MSDSKYRSRRFLLSLLALLMGFALAMMDKDVSGFAWLVGGVLTGYGFTRSGFVKGGDA